MVVTTIKAGEPVLFEATRSVDCLGHLEHTDPQSKGHADFRIKPLSWVGYGKIPRSQELGR